MEKLAPRAARLADAFDVARRQSATTPGRYVALSVGTSARPLASGAFHNGEQLVQAPRSSIASLTKPITATAVMQLVERGAVDLDAPVATYVPEFRPQPVGGADHARSVTVRRILCHTSGLTDFPDDELVRLTPTPAAMLAAVCLAPLAYVPGSAFRYASEPYYLLAAVIERVGGEPYATVLRDRIFAPLGMAATSFEPAAAGYDSLPLLGTFSGPDLPAEERLAVFASLQMPGGGLWSTPDDLVRFGRAILRGGELDGARLLDRTSVEAMTTLQTAGVPELESGEPIHYALGWGLRPGSGASESAVMHGGATGGVLVVDPAYDAVIVYLRNWWGVDSDDTHVALEAVFGGLGH